jgi:hypothetical protein
MLTTAAEVIAFVKSEITRLGGTVMPDGDGEGFTYECRGHRGRIHGEGLNRLTWMVLKAPLARQTTLIAETLRVIFDE